MTEIQFRSDVDVDLIDSLGDEQSIIRAARVSTFGAMAEKEEAAGLLRYLIRNNHGTPLEAPILQFRITAPKFTTIQTLKHRLSTINEESMRYREFNPTFYVPGNDRPARQVGKTSDYKFEHDSQALMVSQKAHRDIARYSWELYQEQLDAGVAKELARGVLPLSLYSSMFVSMNLRGWINYVQLRTTDYGSAAQFEIAQVAKEVQRVLRYKFPIVMECVDEGM